MRVFTISHWEIPQGKRKSSGYYESYRREYVRLGIEIPLLKSRLGWDLEVEKEEIRRNPNFIKAFFIIIQGFDGEKMSVSASVIQTADSRWTLIPETNQDTGNRNALVFVNYDSRVYPGVKIIAPRRGTKKVVIAQWGQKWDDGDKLVIISPGTKIKIPLYSKKGDSWVIENILTFLWNGENIVSI